MKKHFALLFSLMAVGTTWSMEDPNENKWPQKKGLDPYQSEEIEYSVAGDLKLLREAAKKGEKNRATRLFNRSNQLGN